MPHTKPFMFVLSLAVISLYYIVQSAESSSDSTYSTVFVKIAFVSRFFRLFVGCKNHPQHSKTPKAPSDPKQNDLHFLDSDMYPKGTWKSSVFRGWVFPIAHHCLSRLTGARTEPFGWHVEQLSTLTNVAATWGWYDIELRCFKDLEPIFKWRYLCQWGSLTL